MAMTAPRSFVLEDTGPQRSRVAGLVNLAVSVAPDAETDDPDLSYPRMRRFHQGSGPC